MKDLIINGWRIQPELLEEAQAERCVRHECLSACCSGGAWLDIEQLKSIARYVEAIQANLPDDRRDPDTWFSAPEDDEGAPDGIVLGTNVVDDPARPNKTCCVFLRPDRADRRCALQMTSEQIGLPYPGLKPLFCALYPLRIEHDLVFIDHETPRAFPDATCRRAASSPQPMHRLFREERTLVVGEDGYRQLDARAVSDG